MKALIQSSTRSRLGAILLTLCAVPVLAPSASAQEYYVPKGNKEVLHTLQRRPSNSRTEFVLPANIGGYLPVKADLHLHSFFSDGHVTPADRVREAWLDGLDAIAVTEHIEYHPYDKDMVAYLSRMLPEGFKLPSTKTDPEHALMQDHNFAVKLAQKASKGYGIMIIPGTEITRSPEEIGHYNALFTTDNNSILALDPIESIRNAKKQGALIMHNHPGWRRSSLKHPEIERQAYAEGLIDGVEVINGDLFSPALLERCRELGIFAAATTDLHLPSAEEYAAAGLRRDMTLILAKDKTLDGMRDALTNRRTIALGANGAICGNEELLKDLFISSIAIKTLPNGNVQLDNPTSIRFVVEQPDSDPVVIPSAGAIIIKPKQNDTLSLTVRNMWTGADSHPTFTIKMPK